LDPGLTQRTERFHYSIGPAVLTRAWYGERRWNRLKTKGEAHGRDKATVFNLLSWWHGKRVQAEVRWSGRPEQAHCVTTTMKIVATDRTDANETCGTRTLSWRRAGTVAGAMGGE
jgi:hypothetical protein